MLWLKALSANPLVDDESIFARQTSPIDASPTPDKCHTDTPTDPRHVAELPALDCALVKRGIQDESPGQIGTAER